MKRTAAAKVKCPECGCKISIGAENAFIAQDLDSIESDIDHLSARLTREVRVVADRLRVLEGALEQTITEMREDRREP